MARTSKLILYLAVAAVVSVYATLVAGQCSGQPEVMQCNVPYWCNLRVGGFPLTSKEVDDCACWQLCNDAWNQGEGSTCQYQDDTDGSRWYRIIFDRYDGDNNYRGTVFCDPKGKEGGPPIHWRHSRF